MVGALSDVVERARKCEAVDRGGGGGRDRGPSWGGFGIRSVLGVSPSV